MGSFDVFDVFDVAILTQLSCGEAIICSPLNRPADFILSKSLLIRAKKSFLEKCQSDGLIGPNIFPSPWVLNDWCVEYFNYWYHYSDHFGFFTFTGCNGQIGKALSNALKNFNVIGVDISHQGPSTLTSFHQANVTSMKQARDLIEAHRPQWVFHLPAILSGGAEKNFSAAMKTLRVNVDSFVHMIRLAKQYNFRLFCPSTIAAFGSETPKIAQDTTVMAPHFLYGTTKVYNELLGDYFHRRYGVDYRSIRLPGVLSANASAGTGTTGKNGGN